MTGKTGDEPAFPYRYSDGADYTGMTLRQYVAIQIVAGSWANPNANNVSAKQLARLAVEQADTLVKELSK